MGAQAGKAKGEQTTTGKQGKGLDAVTARAKNRAGMITVTGRYHKLPKRFSDDYQTSSTVLGSGYNGEVKLAKSKSSGKDFAVKAFKLRGAKQDKKDELETEVEIFLAMDHPHVARLADAYEDNDQLILVMECMSGGELFDRVIERKRFGEKDAAEAMYQMLLAINYIHGHGIVHRDIKLENFLYEEKGSDHLKLIDFGFSKIWNPNTTMAMSCGTLAYVAPEVLNGSYTSQCDLWSLGVVAFILLFGYMPFSGAEEQQIKDIKAGKYSKKKAPWERVSTVGQKFVKDLLVVDPKQRLTAAKALEHEWLEKRQHHNVTHIDEAILQDMLNFRQASAFRKAAMSVMAWSLTNDERKMVRDAFLELDTSRSGTITLAEFRNALVEKFHISDAAVLEAFKALDTNHTDEIHYSEFLAAMVSSRIAIHDDLLKGAFKRFDTDNSGFISVENLREVLGDSFEGAEVEKLLQEADLKQDGKISYEEWIAYLKGGDSKDEHTSAAARVIDGHIKNQERRPTMMRKAAPEGTGLGEVVLSDTGNRPADYHTLDQQYGCCGDRCSVQ